MGTSVRLDSNRTQWPGRDRSSSRAHAHNLKGIDVALPRDSLVVVTGPRARASRPSPSTPSTPRASGATSSRSRRTRANSSSRSRSRTSSGSTASLRPSPSSSARLSKSPRSTVGTVTEIADYLRLLFARVGVPHCPSCGSADRGPDGPADRRPRPHAPAHHSPLGARPHLPRPQGRARSSVREAAPRRVRAGARRRRRAWTSATTSSSIDPVPARPRVIVDRLVMKDGLRRAAHRRVELAPHSWARAWSARALARRRATEPPRARRQGLSGPSAGKRGEVLRSPNASPAWPAASRSRESSHGSSPSTGRTARAPPATGSACATWSTRSGSSAIPRLSSARGRAPRPWAAPGLGGAGDAELSRRRPWRRPGRAVVQAPEEPTGTSSSSAPTARSPRRAAPAEGQARAKMKPYEGIVPRIEGAPRRPVAPDVEADDPDEDEGAVGEDYSSGASSVRRTCTACKGLRLRPEALAVKLGSCNIAEIRGSTPPPRRARLRRAHREGRDGGRLLPPRPRPSPRRCSEDGGRRASASSSTSGSTTSRSIARADALRWRRAAHPARHADRRGAGRRAVRARRAFGGLARPRQHPPSRSSTATRRYR